MLHFIFFHLHSTPDFPSLRLKKIACGFKVYLVDLTFLFDFRSDFYLMPIWNCICYNTNITFKFP
jgi:hypothetical protein